ncbi:MULTISPECIES: exodeoxyribonuclease V subunit gamma [unclassified Synechococcus]|uniref:exodeoxyribonuclease V subunit gamma n=1 Tax=unclassified Synechococcus TaxID=2626047 RepID=UPI0021A74EC0|nr:MULTISPECIES: exodeoxyribonuclease V subunit gamma [unclassified Synechococcus]MCT0214263.1 exodeoxyribonuclease V subunit gamma [Synechococcus sp. CS-1326]MCT0234427.1 exodeoxyribonuclease V subunit gamma [Synechococcus sp. CS-1327]
MLTVYRSNRAEFLAQLLAQQLRLDPPSPWETIQVVVNTWPTSRWLGEQLAVELGGIVANLRFPFPASRLRQIVNHLLDDAAAADDPWRATNLVWPVLELLPELAKAPEAFLLERWLQSRGDSQRLDAPLWQLGRAIADSLDDLTLYRPAMLATWSGGQDRDDRGEPLPELQRWQPLLFRQLQARLGVQPFGLRLIEAIERLRLGTARVEGLTGTLRLFGLSSGAPLQVQLLQALSAVLPVDIYLLTPCRDLWQRCSQRRQELRDAVALTEPFALDWLVQAPALEGRFGRLGGEFQQLLEGTGEAQLGCAQERDLFFLPATAATAQGRSPRLLEQLQEQLVEGAAPQALSWRAGDRSLEFHPCPGRLRQVQIVRDRLLQLMAEDSSLEPRHILVMTPDVDRLAPLLAAVFGDTAATGVVLPWRLTDRSQQGEAGLSAALLQLLLLGGERLTASALETLLQNTALQEHFQLESGEAAALSSTLQTCGFRWGLAAEQRGGNASHSLSWAIDRLLLGLALPDQAGVAVGDCAPHRLGGTVEQLGRWIRLLTSLRQVLTELARAHSAAEWAARLPPLLTLLFGDGGDRAWELQTIREAIASWHQSAASCDLQLTAPVVAAVLKERLSADSGRFGHRSGALTISALEPMRAIPHRVIVLIGLDAGAFPRQGTRPGFDLMENHRRLGDPHSADQDRYGLIEALLSARDHLLICWNCREEHSGEPIAPAAPVRQWLELVRSELGEEAAASLLVNHPASPLDRRNFLVEDGRQPASCDQRLLRVLQQLERSGSLGPGTDRWEGATAPLILRGPGRNVRGEPGVAAATERLEAEEAYRDLRHWLIRPQDHWLRSLGLEAREWSEAIEDLEDLELDERQRAALLRGVLDADPAPGGADPPDWIQRTRGRGLLPPLAAGILEAQALNERWGSLKQCLERLGTPHQETHHWQPPLVSLQPLQATVLWHDTTLVLVKTSKAQASHRLELALQLILSGACGAQASGAVLVARHENSFAVVEKLRPPTSLQAGSILEQWLGWHQRSHCWPVPPATGWAYAEAELASPGTGLAKATACWEGSGFGQRAEREDPAISLCFGRDTTARELVAGTFGPFHELSIELQTPLLALRSEP